MPRGIFSSVEPFDPQCVTNAGKFCQTKTAMASLFVDYDPRNVDRDAKPFVLRELGRSTRFRMTAVEMVELKGQIARALEEHAERLRMTST